VTACPACGEPLFGWLLLEPGGQRDPRDAIALERCERCGLGIAADLDAGSASELLGSPHRASDGRLELRVANRASLQASLGGRHWAALDPQRPLYPTERSLHTLAAAAGLEIVEVRCARRGRAQAWMWQTILNAFTFHENFALEVRAGTLRPGGSWSRLKFGIDGLVTALVAVPAAIVSVPLELFAALAGKGGELMAVVRPARGAGLPVER
jgi:hypothetical protein